MLVMRSGTRTVHARVGAASIFFAEGSVLVLRNDATTVVVDVSARVIGDLCRLDKIAELIRAAPRCPRRLKDATDAVGDER